jgi:hypothetical protein
MLNELEDLQESEESVWTTSMTFDIETRSEDGNELVHKKYVFSYAREWDKWTFSEYEEKRTPDTSRMGDRDWRQSRHIFWKDVNETPTIDVPPEVSKALADATGSESVTIQVPFGSVQETKYKQFTYECD